MKKATSVLLSLAVVASIGSSAVVQAQVSNPVKFTVFGGAALPVGDTKTDLKTGYSVGGAVDLRAPLSSLGVRGELVYSSLDAKDTGGLGSASMNDFGGNANVVFWLPNPGSPLTAYLTGGPSYSHLTAKATAGNVTQSVSDNQWGFNVGAGIDFALSGLSTRLDVRYRRLSSDGGPTQYIPITFGVTF